MAYLELYNNHLTGTIPSSIGEMAGITYLGLGYNQLTGTIPAALANLKLLSTLNLADNKLSGLVPPLPFAQYTGECILDDHICHGSTCNHFSCPLPANSNKCEVHCGPPTPCIGTSSTLKPTQCAAYQELFDSTAGAGWSGCSNSRLDPCSCGNTACSSAPCVKCENQEITALWLEDNALKGAIPNSIGELTSTAIFNLRLNFLTGTIPKSVGLMKPVGALHIYLDHNHLTGTIPTTVANLLQLTHLELAYNELSGAVPPLPFAQYTGSCFLDAPCTPPRPQCNRFSCPLPANSEKCVLKGAAGAGVHCK
jgi:Leucine-rich repeat (LRR) protein